ncbi:MAG: preprotein translocase subunit SecY [Planctomycetes bacterium]|nr:preprotein translocase subunit SecY [Planctomycetota bacterium]
MFSAFSNIAKIPELRKKLGMTLGLLILCRIGVFIPLPGINLAAVQKAISTTRESGFAQVFGILDMFSGGGLNNASIFALGIMPYISASIIFQLLTAIVPSLQKVAKDGESGRRKITQWTRYATIGLCMVQATIICQALSTHTVADGQNMVTQPGLWFLVQSAIILSTGSAFLMWLGEQIDEFGIGNGMSLIIMIGITSRLPVAFENIFKRFDPAIEASASSIGPSEIFTLMLLFVAMVVAVVFVTEATRRIPMQTPKRTRVGFRQQHYLPLKINASGVIAIIFAQSLMILPNFMQMLPVTWWQELMNFFAPHNSFFYMTIYLLLIVFFSYFYTAVIFDPKEHAENFKQYGMFIPGIRPGNDTRVYLEAVMNRITFAGAIFIAIIAIMPQIIQGNLKVDYNVSGFFGGTGLLIVVGVALDVINRIESYMLMERYEGFLKGGGRIRGRRG